MLHAFRLLIFCASLLAFTLLPAARADDAAHRAAVEELLKTMRMDELQAKTTEQVKTMVMSMAARALQDQPNAAPEATAEVQKMQSEIMDLIFRKLSWNALKDDYVKIYAEVFTDAELRDLTTFYRTPSGQKFLEKQPQLVGKAMELSQSRMREIMPEIQALASRSLNSAKARAAMSAAPPAPPMPAATASPTPVPEGK